MARLCSHRWQSRLHTTEWQASFKSIKLTAAVELPAGCEHKLASCQILTWCLSITMILLILILISVPIISHCYFCNINFVVLSTEVPLLHAYLQYFENEIGTEWLDALRLSEKFAYWTGEESCHLNSYEHFIMFRLLLRRKFYPTFQFPCKLHVDSIEELANSIARTEASWVYRKR